MTCTDTSKGRKHVAGLLALTLLLGTAACGGEADGPVEEGDLAEGTAGSVPGADLGSEVAEDDGVAQVAQGLGGFETIWSAGGAAYTPLHFGPLWAVFSRREASSTCETFAAVLLSAAVEVRLSVPGCEKMRSAVSSTDAVFVADPTTGKMYRLDLAIPFEWKLTEIVSSGVFPVGPMALSSTHVFWADGAGIKRVPRAGGTLSFVKVGSGIQVLAVEGSTLYYRTGLAPVSLRKIQTGGTGDTLVQSVPGDVEGFTFNADHFYWTNNFAGVAVRKLQRRPKNQAVIETLEQSTESVYRFPHANGLHLYWHQEGPGHSVVCRRNLASGFQQCSNLWNVGRKVGMTVNAEGVHVASVVFDVTDPGAQITKSGL